MAVSGRDRHAPVDDRHQIRDPKGSVQDVKAWENTLHKERVSDLCRTAAGFRGHLVQIQQEINRAGTVRRADDDPQVTKELIAASQRLRDGIKKVILVAHQSGVVLPEDARITFPLAHDTLVVGKVIAEVKKEHKVKLPKGEEKPKSRSPSPRAATPEAQMRPISPPTKSRSPSPDHVVPKPAK